MAVLVLSLISLERISVANVFVAVLRVYCSLDDGYCVAVVVYSWLLLVVECYSVKCVEFHNVRADKLVY